MCSALQCAAHCPSRLGADEDIKILQTRSRPITSMLFLQHIKPVLVHSLSLHLWWSISFELNIALTHPQPTCSGVCRIFSGLIVFTFSCFFFAKLLEGRFNGGLYMFAFSWLFAKLLEGLLNSAKDWPCFSFSLIVFAFSWLFAKLLEGLLNF